MMIKLCWEEGFGTWEALRIKTLTIRVIPKILVNSAITTSVILLIIGAANVVLWLLTTEQVPQKVSTFFLSLSRNPYVLLLIVNIILLLVGCFMETGAAGV